MQTPKRQSWHWFGGRQHREPARRKSTGRSRRLALARLGLEPLEQRRMLAVVSWDGAGDGTSWFDQNNWSGHALPGTGDDVSIAAGAGTTIVINNHSNGVFVNSITSNSPITLLDGTLAVATTAQLSANITVDDTVQGGAYDFTNGAQMVIGQGYFTAELNGLTVNGNIDAATNVTQFFIDSGLTLNGTMTLGNATGSTFGVAVFGDGLSPAGVLGGTATIVFGNSGSNALEDGAMEPGDQSLTIGPNVIIHGQSGSIFDQSPPLATNEAIVNEGEISADNAGGTIHLPNFITNQGTIQATNGGTLTFVTLDNQAGATISANGGTITQTGQLSNEGSIQDTNGGNLTLINFTNASGATLSADSSTLTLQGSLSNLGTITVTNSAVYLAGDFSQANMGNFVRNGGTITVTGTIEGDINLNAATGSWILASALLNGGNLNESDGVTAGYASSATVFLANKTINGDLNMTLGDDSIVVLGTLTVNGTLRLGSPTGATASTILFGTSFMQFAPGSPFRNTPEGFGIHVGPAALEGNATVIFGPSASNAFINQTVVQISKSDALDPTKAPYIAAYPVSDGTTYYVAGGDFSIGAGVQIQGGNGGMADEYNRGTITSDATVSVAGAGSAITIGGNYFVGVTGNYFYNDGTIQVTGGASLTLGGLVNNGTITADGSSLEFAGTIANSSSIVAVDNATVFLDGDGFTQAELGNFSRTGSTVELIGRIVGGITLDANTGSWFLNGGTVDHGTITESGGSELAYINGILNSVTVDGDMNLDGSFGEQFDAIVQIYNGLTLNGTMYVGNLAGSTVGQVEFGNFYNAPGALSGTGTVVFGGNTSDSFSNDWTGSGTGTLTIGPGITIHGKSGYISSVVSQGAITIQGNINADTSGGTIALNGITNQGSLSATNGGTLAINGFVNALGHSISTTGATLSLSGTWTNYGVLTSTNSTVNLGGSLTRASLGSFNRTGGTVNLTGTYTGELPLNAITGSWVIDNGTILGGPIDESGGSDLIINSGTLNAVTVNGNIDDTQVNGSSLNVYNGLVLNGTMSIGNVSNYGGYVYFGGQGTNAAGALTGNGTIVFIGFQTKGLYNESYVGNQTLTIGPNITIEGSYGLIGNLVDAATTIIQGHINADVAGGTIQISNGIGSTIVEGSVQANGGSIVSNSAITVSGQGTLGITWSGSYSITGGLTGNSTGSAGSDLRGVTTIHGGNPQPLEAMSRDLGLTSAGFQNNFVFGTLDIEGDDVKLVDQFHNAGGTGAEAVYANSLIVGPFSTLDLNGLHLYVRAAQINGEVINGTVSQLPDGGALPINEPLPGAISPVNNVDDWTFYGHAGEVITTYINPGSGAAPSPISPNLNWVGAQLLGPASQVLASGSSSSPGAAVSLANITLPTSGVYTVQINAAASNPNATGNYVVGAFDVTPQVAPLTLAQNTNGTIDTPFSEQLWTFSALAGEQVRFHLINESSTGLVYSLMGPNGFTGFSNIAGDSALVDLPASGTYTLTVSGVNGAVGNYAFVVNSTTQNTVPLNGSINGALAGSGQAELFTVSVPSVQALSVALDDNSNGDSNELYLRYGSPPTREDYDYRYSSANSADQNILVPSAAIGTWYVLVYSDNVPAPTTFTLSTHGDLLRLTGSAPGALGNSAPATLSITGAGFEPGTTATLIGPGGTHYAASSTSVVSFTQLTAAFPAGMPAGAYSLQVTQGTNTSTLNNVITFTVGGSAHLETSLEMPSFLGRHIPATIYVDYANDGTVAMPAPLLILGSTDPNQVPLMTLDASKINQGLWTSTIPEGYSTTLQILASGAIPGVLLPGESIRLPVYYAGLLQPWDTSDTSVPLNLGVIDSTDSGTVDWNSLKSTLQPADVPAAAWNQIFANLTSSLGGTWGQFVKALDQNASYLGSLGENVNDVSKLWGFMYMQADDSLGPVDHLTSVVDSTVALPGGAQLSFWRNYHVAISGRDSFGMLGYGWSVPYQSSIHLNADGSVSLNTVGEETTIYYVDTRGGFFPADDGTTLVSNGDGTYTVQSSDGESDTYVASSGRLDFHTEADGNRITYAYNGAGQLVGMTAATGQSITLTYNTAGLLATLSDSDGNVSTYHYDPTNQYLLSVTDFAGTTTYTYNQTTHALTGIQNVDGSYSNISYDVMGRLATLASADTSMKLSYAQPGEISSTDPLGNIVSEFYNEDDLVVKSIDALGNPTYFNYDNDGNLLKMTDANGDFFSYTYDSSGNLTSATDPLHNATSYTYGADGHLATVTDANSNVTRYTDDANGNLTSVIYPDGTQESFTFNPLGQPMSFVQRNGQAIAYSYDSSGNVSQETFGDGSHYNYTYDAYGNLLTATDSGGTTAFTYNAVGQMTSVSYPNGTSLTYSYNSIGQPTQVVDQSGYKVSYAYDSAGRPWKLLDASGNPITTYTYDAMSRIVRQDNANGTYTTIAYNANGNVLHIVNFAPNNSVSSRFDYGYNTLNQLTSMATLDGTWTYSYDSSGQLIHAVFTSVNPAIANQDLAYSYDAEGNRTSTIINGATTNYTANEMNQYTNIGGTLQQYDANGNLISDGTSTYTYNPLNQLTGISNAQGTTQFTYNALGQEIASNVNGQTTQYLNNPGGFGSVFATSNGTGQVLSHFNYGMGLVSQTTASGANYFYDSDALGSVVGLSNSSGSYADQYSYMPFGQSLASSGTVANPFQYIGIAGTQTDATNLVHMGAREYTPSTGAFMSSDPLQLEGGGTNFYSYTQNQPLQFADPSGLKGITWRYGNPSLVLGPIEPPGFGPSNVATLVPDVQVVSTFNSDAGQVGGPIYDTVKDIVEDVVIHQEVPSLDKVEDDFVDNTFSKLNLGPFQIGLIEETLLKPDVAINIVDGINGVRRSNVCGTINAGEAAQLIAIGMAPPGCADAPGLVLPLAPNKPGAKGNAGVASSGDPNDKIGPAGFGTANFVAAGSLLPYRIDFQNASTATAPAQQVEITDQLSGSLDWSTFRITEIGWGDTVITVPDNSQHFQTTVPVTDNGQTFNVLVKVDINLSTGLVTALFTSIDPVTQLPPDVLTGFLPPEDGTGRGMGHISYVINPRANLPTGTQIRNVAQVSFDEQPIIATDQVSETDPTQGTDPNKEALVTIDAVAPTSAVASLPASESAGSFTVNWSGADDAGGSGVQGYNVWVSVDGAAYSEWQTDTTSTSALYSALGGSHTYAFYSQAIDNAGNIEAAHGTPDTTTAVNVTARVVDVLVDGTSWSPTYLSNLQVAGLGNGNGYAIPVGSKAQLAALPWNDVNQIQVVFNESVNVQENSLALTGLNVANYTFTNFTFNSSTDTATWTLSSSIGKDKVLLDLQATGPYAVTNVGGQALDGQWSNAVSNYPSGSGTPGGDFLFHFNVLPGDVNQDGIVNGQDIAQVASKWLQTAYSMADTKGSGIVNGQDIATIASHWLTSLSAVTGDANNDGIVNGQDIAQVASHWLKHTASGDVNNDGIVNGQDIATIASHWLQIGGGGTAAAASAAVAIDSGDDAQTASSATGTGAAALLASSDSAAPSFIVPPTTDHTASFVGPLNVTKPTTAMDQVFSASNGALNHSLGAWARPTIGSEAKLQFVHGAQNTTNAAVEVDHACERWSSSMDDDLLTTLATGQWQGPKRP